MNFYKHLQSELDLIKIDNLYRDFRIFSSKPGACVEYNGKKILQMSSNNYLGLACDERLIQAVIRAAEKYGIGSTGSRLLSGTHKLHTELEEKLSELKETEKAIVFSTGYAANLGAISAFFNEKDAVYSDELNHAGIIDGIKLSRANKFIYKHCDVNDLESLLEENHKKFRFNVIITDSIFSMDGDRAPLKQIIDLKEKYNALIYLDEAHAFGIYGEKGQGLAHELNLNDKIDIHMGTLSKAAGSEGGYIAGKAELIDYLRNKSRSFIFSTAPSIPVTAASIKAVEVIRDDFGLRKKLHENIKYFKQGLSRLNLDVIPSESAIFCLKLDNIQKAVDISNELLEKHSIMASCIRPPTVKTPRIRLCVSALHTKQDLDYVLEKLAITILSRLL